ncbi:Uu.00g048630.m01.CDS01 [Anthostomella pinea]|uniref:Uu.00g048630.m01.CDS01 n=1 Tax=Anthostomella pinea TaxID=933095 RepID=A0AAI8VBR7_9PEZI|nr:Uu.00g048630.m01.CDS01 [Anthostomella pinea]
MQRVSALLPAWDRNRTSNGTTISHTRKASVDKVRGWADKIPSVNRLSTSSRHGKEAFWPATLDKECEKAARILKSFCSDGFSIPDERPGSPITTSSNHSSNKILKKIPPRIIQNAVGLAVFTSMRSGLWTSGSGGSGILIARKTDGTWSPPSGLMLQTASLGFIIGVDVYDCVLVINNFAVLETFARTKVTLGTDVSMTGGPLVSLGLLENDVTWADLSDTAIAYVKAKGQFSEVKLDGTVLNERADENERFYGMKLNVAKILAGDINQSMPQTRLLAEVLKAAEGRVDYDMALVDSLSSQPAPGDAMIESPQSAASSHSFGLPDTADPDPFGVLALEMAGVGIREAGSQLRPGSSQFEYHPSPTSPLFPKVGRQSIDTFMSRSNRGSYTSNKTAATERSQITNTGTQTYSATTPETTPTHSLSQSEDGNQRHSSDEILEVKEPEEVDYTQIDISALRSLSNFPDLDDEPTVTDATWEAPLYQSENKQEEHIDESEHEDDADDEEEDGGSLHASEDEYDDNDEAFDEVEEAVVFEVATAQTPARMVASQVVQAKGAVVSIPRRVPPPLPLRSPARTSRRRSQMPDVSSMISSPLRQQFELTQGLATPKAESSPVISIEHIDGAAEKKQEDGEPHHEASEAIPAESVAGPAQESQGFDGYFPKVEEQLPQQDSAVTQSRMSTGQQVGLPSQGVPVSVA